MHPSMELLFGHLAGGLVWLSADGRVKYSNVKGRRYTGLDNGQELHDSPLKKAVAVIASGRLERPLDMEFLFPLGEKRIFHVQVAPAMSAGDAFMFVNEAAPHGEALAMNNLMTVIRSDLTQPLDRLSRTLQSVLDGAASVDAVSDSVKNSAQVADTLRRLVDLAELWASDSLLANDRIEIWPLLQQAWAHSQAFAEARRITVRLANKIEGSDMPVTYGSEFWIRRVVTESLQAALRAAAPGATVDIELRQMGPRVLIVFRNSGMWPAASRDVVMLNDGKVAKPAAPGQRPAPPQVNAKDLIGLHLCERIIRLHGGLLREEDDDGLRNFLIDLPTGAPGREGHDATMDAAQAQRYAADLAALMARRRKATPTPPPAASR